MDEQSIQEIERNKKWSLRRYRNNLSCVSRLERKLALLDERITTIKSPNFSGMPKGGVPVTIEDLLSDKMDLEKRIKRLKKKGKEIKESILEEIDSLEDSRYCDVLEAYFIDGLSIEKIAENMGYTERHIYTLYKEAISILSVSTQ